MKSLLMVGVDLHGCFICLILCLLLAELHLNYCFPFPRLQPFPGGSCLWIFPPSRVISGETYCAYCWSTLPHWHYCFSWSIHPKLLKQAPPKVAGALPAGSRISAIMFPGRDDSPHNHFIVPLNLCLLSAFHYCHHQSDHISSKPERQWCSHKNSQCFWSMFSRLRLSNNALLWPCNAWVPLVMHGTGVQHESQKASWVRLGMPGTGVQHESKKASSRACQPSPEVTPYHSGSLSHHWGHCRVLLALLPAWAGAPIIIHQDITTYAVLPLWSAHLVRASHQRGQKDMMRAHTLHWPASTRMTGGRDPSQLSSKHLYF